MASEGDRFIGMIETPGDERPFAACCGQELPQRMERDRVNIRRRDQAQRFQAAAAVEHADAAARAGDGERALVRAERYVEDMLVRAKHTELAGLNLVPDADEAVVAAGGDHPIAVDSQRFDAVGEAEAGGEELAGAGVPEFDFAASQSLAAAAGKECAAGSESQAFDRPVEAAQ